MTDRTLAAVLKAHRLGAVGGFLEPGIICLCGDELEGPVEHAAHVAAAYREARTIRTVEELDALPLDAVAKGSDGDTFTKTGYAWRRGRPGLTSTLPAGCIQLPATLLYHPDDDTETT